MIVIGVDGGTTRTRAAVVSERGDVLGTGHAGPANFQICGMSTAMNSIRHAVSSALDAAHCTRRAVSHIVFGLSGMDLPLHRHRLDEGLTASFNDTPFDLVNDTWIMLRAGTDKGWGIALVCGGGANACARDEQGVWTTLRGLGYESGMRGGGLDLLRDVTHAAFMAHDGLAPATMLEHVLLDVTGARDYEALQLMLLQAMQDTTGSAALLVKALNVVPLIFEGASAGDEVCKRILLLQAESLAEGVVGLLHRMRFEAKPVDIVLGGAIFGASYPLLVDRLTVFIREVAPEARLQMPRLAPVLGACLMSLERVDIPLDTSLYEHFANWTSENAGILNDMPLS